MKCFTLLSINVKQRYNTVENKEGATLWCTLVVSVMRLAVKRCCYFLDDEVAELLLRGVLYFSRIDRSSSPPLSPRTIRENRWKVEFPPKPRTLWGLRIKYNGWANVWRRSLNLLTLQTALQHTCVIARLSSYSQSTIYSRLSVLLSVMILLLNFIRDINPYPYTILEVPY